MRWKRIACQQKPEVTQKRNNRATARAHITVPAWRASKRAILDFAPYPKKPHHPIQSRRCRLSSSPPIQLEQPRVGIAVLLAAAEQSVRKIYEPGFRLNKAGAILLDLSPATHEQASSIEMPQPAGGRDMSAFMETMDHINARWGKGSVCVGSVPQASG